MENKHALYVMLSRTSTRMGTMIRLFTHYEFNHVSVSLDPSFRHWLSFARYAQEVPLAGGFVQESPRRLLSADGSLPVRIFGLVLTEAEYERLVLLFARAEQQKSRLIYNTLDALASAAGCRFPLPGAYTCLGFAEVVLGRKYPTIRALDEDLQAHLVYQGDFREIVTPEGSETADDARYFSKRGVPGGIRDTVFHFARLFGRICRRSRYEDPLSPG